MEEKDVGLRLPILDSNTAAGLTLVLMFAASPLCIAAFITGTEAAKVGPTLLGFCILSAVIWVLTCIDQLQFSKDGGIGMRGRSAGFTTADGLLKVEGSSFAFKDPPTTPRCRRILWVSEETEILDNYKESLEQDLQVEVVYVKTTADAFVQLERQQYGLIVSNATRTEGGVADPDAGAKFWIKASIKYPDVSIIFCTSIYSIDRLKEKFGTDSRVLRISRSGLGFICAIGNAFRNLPLTA